MQPVIDARRRVYDNLLDRLLIKYCFPSSHKTGIVLSALVEALILISESGLLKQYDEELYLLRPSRYL